MANSNSSNLAPWPDKPLFIVDDDVQWLTVVQQALKSMGWRRITTLSEPLYTVQLAHEFKPAAVLLDLVMSEKSGRQVLRELRESFPDLPIIIVTAKEGADEAVGCMRDGATDYLVKPLNRSQLKKALERNILGPDSEKEYSQMNFSELLSVLETLPSLKEAPDLLIQEAMHRTDGVVKEAAKLLGVSAQAICNRRRRSG